MIRFLCACVLVSLVGCATVEGNKTAAREKFRGKELAAVTASIGYPSRDLKMGNKQLYVWEERDEWGNVCELRLEVDPKGIVVGESLHSRIPEACMAVVR